MTILVQPYGMRKISVAALLALTLCLPAQADTVTVLHAYGLYTVGAGDVTVSIIPSYATTMGPFLSWLPCTCSSLTAYVWDGTQGIYEGYTELDEYWQPDGSIPQAGGTGPVTFAANEGDIIQINLWNDGYGNPPGFPTSAISYNAPDPINTPLPSTAMLLIGPLAGLWWIWRRKQTL
jgi:hypothetical protein